MPGERRVFAAVMIILMVFASFIVAGQVLMGQNGTDYVVDDSERNHSWHQYISHRHARVPNTTTHGNPVLPTVPSCNFMPIKTGTTHASSSQKHGGIDTNTSASAPCSANA